jgi:hypothetical protein
MDFKLAAKSTAVTRCPYPYFGATLAYSHASMPDSQNSMYTCCFFMGMDGK